MFLRFKIKKLVFSSAFFSQYSESNLNNLILNMPKNRKHVIEAQKQRQKLKEKSSKYVPGTVSLHVLGTGAEGAPRALYVFTDHTRYLFNCGEGTQRLAHEHKMKLSRLEHVFITQASWPNLGGLPGLSLTIQDVGVGNINLHGPSGLDELFAATRKFVVLKNLEIGMADCDPNVPYEDNVMIVQYVPIMRPPKQKSTQEVVSLIDESQISESEESSTRGRSRKRGRSTSSASSDESVDYYAYESKRGKRRRSMSKRSRDPSIASTSSAGVSNTIAANLKALINEPKDQNVVMTYICRLQPRPGALNLDKCVEYGIPPGPLLGKLKNGEDVVVDGKTVYSHEVRSPDDPGPVFIVVDCPEIEYLESLISSPEWKKHQGQCESENDIASAIVHFTPPEICQDIRYQTWINCFPPSTKHIMINSTSSCLGSHAVHRVQHQLNTLHENIFPSLGESNPSSLSSLPPVSHNNKLESYDTVSSDPPSANQSLNQSIEDIFYPLMPSKTLWSLHLRPKKGFDRSNEVELVNQKDIITETWSIEGMSDAISKLKHDISNHERKQKNSLQSEDYPNILFLGTGSCIPNKTRNTSGILVQTSPSSYMLLDCGEGTYGQIIRFFGLEKATTVLEQLKAIYISHLHADHHIGLVGLLLGRQRLLKKAGIPYDGLYLLAPKQIMWWLNMYNRRFESILDEFIMVPNGVLIPEKVLDASNYLQDVYKKIEIKRIETTIVKHCPNAFGVAIHTLSGRKLTYSGDTMPCDDLNVLGRDSDILIHEATMEDDLAHEARLKMHSTISQAIQAGKTMKAKYVLLTHFSQRYARIPRIPGDVLPENVGIAFDNMVVRVSDLPILHMLYPPLKLLFHEHAEELENKATKRLAKALRLKSPSASKRKRSVSQNSNDTIEESSVITISSYNEGRIS